MRAQLLSALACEWNLEIFRGFDDDEVLESWRAYADRQVAQLNEEELAALRAVQQSIDCPDDPGADEDEKADVRRRRDLDILDIMDAGEEKLLERAWQQFERAVADGVFAPAQGQLARSADEWQALGLEALKIALRKVGRPPAAEAIAKLSVVRMARREHRLGPVSKPVAYIRRVARNVVHDYFRSVERLRKKLSELSGRPMVTASQRDLAHMEWALSALGEIGELQNRNHQNAVVGRLLLNVPRRLLATWLEETDSNVGKLTFDGLRALKARLPTVATRTLADTASVLAPILVRLAERALAHTQLPSGPDGPHSTTMNKPDHAAPGADAHDSSALRVALEHGLSRGDRPSDWWFASAVVGNLPADVCELLRQVDGERMRAHEARMAASSRRFRAALTRMPLLVRLASSAFELLRFDHLAQWLTEPSQGPGRLQSYAQIGEAPLTPSDDRDFDIGVMLRLTPSATPGCMDVVVQERASGCRDLGLQSLQGDEVVYRFDEKIDMVTSVPVGEYLLFYEENGEERLWPFLVEDGASES